MNRRAFGLAFRLPALIALAMATAGCQQFGEQDVATLERYGGTYIPSGEGPAARRAPVLRVAFESRSLSDGEFAAVFPTVQRMDPQMLILPEGVTDASMPLVGRLRALLWLDASRTSVTPAGLSALHLRRLKELRVPRGTFDESSTLALRRALPGTRVSN